MHRPDVGCNILQQLLFLRPEIRQVSLRSFLQPNLLHQQVIRLIRRLYLGALNYLQPIALCANGWTSSDVSTYTGPSLFTCSANFSNCANFNFSLASSAITSVNITGQPASTSSLAGTSTPAALSPTATVTVTATATPAPVTIRYKTSTGVLAAAIAVPLVLTAILLLMAWFFIAEHKRRRNAEQLIQEWNNTGANAGGVLGFIERPPELGGDARNELPAG
jgi:hypothetical protein